MIIFLYFLLFWIGLSFRYSYIIFALLALTISFFTFRKYKIKIASVGLLIFAIGIGISYIQIDNKGPDYSGFIIESKENYFILFSKGEKLYVYSKHNDYEIGDYLSIKGSKEKTNFTKIESQFDFSSYFLV